MYSAVLAGITTLGFQIYTLNSNIVICKLMYYIPYVSLTYFPILLILASIDRLLISSQNVDTRLYSSKRLAYLLVSTSFAITIIFSLHILIQVDLQEFYPTVFYCTYKPSNWYPLFLSYSVLILNLVPSLVLFIMAIFSFKNVRHLRAIPREKRGRIRQMTKKDFQLLQCLYVHDTMYLCSIVLITVSMIYGVIYPDDDQTIVQQATYRFLTSFGGTIHGIFRCSSFCIFFCVSKAFRQQLKRCSYELCGRNPNGIIQEENQAPEFIGRESIVANNVHVNTIDLHY